MEMFVTGIGLAGLIRRALDNTSDNDSSYIRQLLKFGTFFWNMFFVATLLTVGLVASNITFKAFDVDIWTSAIAGALFLAALLTFMMALMAHMLYDACMVNVYDWYNTDTE